MKGYILVGALVTLATLPFAVRAQAPTGWKMRVDRSTSASDPDAPGAIKFRISPKGSSIHATTPQAAVFWNPAHTATGTYAVKATFTQLKLSEHTNFYGLVFGGRALEGPAQAYLYFMVAQDGAWLIKRRDGAKTMTVGPRRLADVIRRPNIFGKCTNTLEVRVLADRIDYVVNGVVVTKTPRTGPTAETDGIYGIRVNHLLDVQIDGFAMTMK